MPDFAESKSEKSTELKLFLILTIVLAPILTIALVGAFGLSIWIYQMIVGPPGI